MKKSLAVAALLLLAMATPAQAGFPGANGRIAFIDYPKLISADFSGGFPGGRITVDDGPASTPAWSPDGTKIVFTRDFRSFNQQALFVVNADGSGLTQITNLSGGRSDSNPAWSPDGKRIVFDSRRGEGSEDLYVVNNDGTGEVQLTDDPGADLLPAWSPDGQKIAFAGHRGPVGDTGFQTTELFVMSASGGPATGVTHGRNAYPYVDFSFDPNWSPDGKRLVFSRTSCDLSRPGSCQGDLFIIDVDGGNEFQVTVNPTDDLAPAWSPDGSRIAFQRDEPTDIYGFRSNLFAVNPDGTRLERLTFTSPASESDPDWQPLDRPPVCTGATVSLAELANANRKFVTVAISGVTEPDSDALSLTFTGVTQDEPVTQTGGGDPTKPDARRMPGGLQLRAERNPQGDGRVYHVTFTASDGRGGSCSGEVTVSVPRHARKPAVDSAPPSYDSFAR